MTRTGRPADELRSVSITRGYTDMTPGSVLIEVGRTRVLCTAGFDRDLPRWVKGTGRGWLTAEYSMLPGSTRERVPRSALSGGRTKEIQRLIGRALRAVVDLTALGEVVVRVDCDVLQADGGTRTAAITGAWVALHDAVAAGLVDGTLAGDPITGQVAAVSVGLLGADAVVDLDYEEDVAADVDMNLVMTGTGHLVEVQGTAEGRPFARADLDRLLDLGTAGIRRLLELQTESVGQ